MTARTAAPRTTGCALVTGASRGIGAATALVLADAGWRCGINYHTDEYGASTIVEQIRARGGQAVAVCADISESHSAETVFTTLEDLYGPVLCLVNNAGRRDDALGVAMTDDQWSTVIRTDLDAAFFMCRRAIGPMLYARWGRIINVASVAGMRASRGQCNYSAAKAGLIGFTRSLAVEVARRGITANVVAPGIVRTQMTHDVPSALDDLIPAQRSGQPEDIANAIAFLASESASYITGATLPIDGGLSA